MHTKYKHCFHLPTIDVTFSFSRCFPPAVSPRCSLPIGSPELTPPLEVHLLSSPHFEVDLLSSSVMSFWLCPPLRSPDTAALISGTFLVHGIPCPSPRGLPQWSFGARRSSCCVSPRCVSSWHHHLR